MSRRTEPATKAMAITPNDATDFSDSGSAVQSRGVSVSVSGDIAFKDENNVTRLAKAMAAGVIHPISTKRIMATGTTATGICIYW